MRKYIKGRKSQMDENFTGMISLVTEDRVATNETAPAGPVRHLSDRSIRSMDRSEIFDISGTGPRSLISKQMN